MITRLLFLLLMATSFVSCKHNPPASSTNNFYKVSSKLNDTVTIHKADTNLLVQDFPLDTAVYPAHILTAGGFHDDEVDPHSEHYKWIGLFKAGNNFYLKRTQLHLSRDTDSADEPRKMTGWVVTPSVKDSAFIFISGLPHMQERQVHSISLAKKQLLPGEQQKFTYNGTTYILYATGTKKADSPGSNFFMVDRYHLYLKADVRGRQQRQLLASIGRLTDTFASFLFAGDIDGDGLPDFILNTSSEENVETTTLYLSKFAAKGQLLKVVGLHWITGC